MFVCGGLTTCCSVCSGVVIVARKRCSRAGRHLANALAVAAGRRAAAAEAAAAAAERAALAALAVLAAPPTVMPAFCEARLHRRELGRGRARDLPVDLDLLAAGLDLRDDLRHRPRLVHGGEDEAARDRRDAVDLRDLRPPSLCGKVSCVPGRKKSWTNLSPGLPSFERSVITDWLAWITSRPPPKPPPPKPPCAASLRLRRERHRQVGADARERVERLRLRLVEAARERRDGDHERDADREAEHGQDRAALAPHELAPQIAEEEHPRAIEAALPESHLRVCPRGAIASLRCD